MQTLQLRLIFLYLFLYLLIISFVSLCKYISTLDHALAQSSSSYARQVVEDPIGDVKSPYTKNTTGNPVTYISPTSSCRKENSASLDIESASFRSDGKTLKSTIWLKNPFIESPKPQYSKSWKHVEYTMYLSLNSVYHIGVDYVVRLFWNNTGNVWTYQVVEISPFHEQVLSSVTNPKGVYSNGTNYVNLDFDLAQADSPQQYQLFFVTGATFIGNMTEKAGGKKFTTSNECGLLDVTSLVSAPPPEFSISFSPSSLELRPSSWLNNEEKSVELKIQSKTNLYSNALFLVDDNRTHGIQTNLTSRQLSLLPEDTSSTALKVKALGDQLQQQSYPVSYSIPILTNITFPQNFTADIGQKYTFDSNKIATITKNSTLSLTVLPPLGPFDYLQMAANWLSPINSIWTFITAAGVVIVPIILRRYSKKKSDKPS